MRIFTSRQADCHAPLPLTLELSEVEQTAKGLAVTNQKSSRGTTWYPCWSGGRLLQSLALLCNGKPNVILRNEGSVLLLNRCFACGSAWQAIRRREERSDVAICQYIRLRPLLIRDLH